MVAEVLLLKGQGERKPMLLKILSDKQHPLPKPLRLAMHGKKQN